MSENVVARLRQKVDGRVGGMAGVSVLNLATLLDIVEEVAAYDCPPDPEAGWGFCMYCAADTESEPHAPDCPYRRARELCGMGGDA